MLQTKFRLPPVRPFLLLRRRLIETLKRGLSAKLVLVSAPAGFGKTTLVAGWLQKAERPFGWLSLDEEDNDPVRFLSGLAFALQQVDAATGQTATALLQAPQQPPVETILTSLLNDIAVSGDPTILALDDYHFITSDIIHQAVTFLLDNLPGNLHLILITRTEPPLPLARLRARAQLIEIGQAALRFKHEEIAAFLNNTLALELTPEQIAALAGRTEGWIAALQLAAVSLPGRADIDQFITEFGGSHRHVVDYLAEEVFRQQPAVVQKFLQTTAVLDRFTAPLCDALTHSNNSHQLLTYLEQNNLFLIPLDERREWYRYHPLFADFLRQGLTKEKQSRLQRQAAGWFVSRNLLPEAIHYALAAPDEHTPDLIALAAYNTLLNGEQTTLRRWLAALPDEVIAAHGELSTYQGWLHFQAGEIEAAAVAAAAAEAALSAETTSLLYGRLRTLQAWLALHQQAAEVVVGLAREAVALVAAKDDAFHALALTALGEAHEAAGETAVAVQVYRQAVVASRELARPVATLLALVHLVITLNESGRRQEAITLCRQVSEQRHKEWSDLRPFTDAIYLVWGYLAYEANQLEQAQSQLATGLSVWQQLGVGGALLFGRHMLAQVQRAGGDLDAARQTAHTLRWQAAEQQSANYVSWADAFLHDIHRQQGNVTAAARWAATTGLTPADKPYPWQWPAYLTYARLLLDQKRPNEALTLLYHLAEAARHGGRDRSLITIYLLQTLAHGDRGDEAESLICLQKALNLAAAEGYVQAFLDEGDKLATWLDRLRSRLDNNAAQQFANRVLRAWSRTDGQTSTALLIEPLTEREMEILQLLVNGRSNPEIGEALVVSLNTVKWHLKNIYGKLHVSNRVEAVTRAQAYGLIE